MWTWTREVGRYDDGVVLQWGDVKSWSRRRYAVC